MDSQSDLTPKRLKRPERRRHTTALLRQAAAREFANNGVAGTSAERIAEAAGFTRGAFYANYENKQAMLLELSREAISAELESWLAISSSEASLDGVFDILNERAKRFDPDGTWSLIAAETHLYAQRDADFAVQYREYHTLHLQGFCNVLSLLFQRAGKQPPLVVEELADALLTLYRTARLPAAHAAPQTARRFSPEMLVLMFRGLIATAPPADAAAIAEKT